MSPRQIVYLFEETYKHVMRDRASGLILQRHAYHAKEVANLYKEMTKFDTQDKKGMTPQELMKAFRG